MTEVEENKTPTPPQITLADLVDVVNLIDLCCQRGAFNGEELSAVGSLRHVFATFIESHNPPENVIGATPQEIEQVQDETNETIE